MKKVINSFTYFPTDDGTIAVIYSIINDDGTKKKDNARFSFVVVEDDVTKDVESLLDILKNKIPKSEG